MIRNLLADEARFLTFRPVSERVHLQWKSYLAFGLLFTWLAGVGRYWDNPRADLWQHLGLGSVLYVFVLAALLFVLLAPFRPANWKYRNVLLFVSLTSPPAILYAIPVERFLTLESAMAANAWFLGVIATWRVALLFRFLGVTCRLHYIPVIVGALLPLTLIVVALSLLNLEHVVFDLMSGIHPDDRSPNDSAYIVVFVLSMFSFFAAPLLAVVYAVLVLLRWRQTRNAPETDT